jgi:hypothetical protein
MHKPLVNFHNPAQGISGWERGRAREALIALALFLCLLSFREDLFSARE